jgi:hypothetical protein
MRNEIFADYGFIFKNVDLQNYFEKKSWYQAKSKEIGKINTYLTPYEKSNIKLIKYLEEMD